MNLKETLEEFGITSIWHFTDRSNLESIEEHGLLSLALSPNYCELTSSSHKLFLTLEV